MIEDLKHYKTVVDYQAHPEFSISHRFVHCCCIMYVFCMLAQVTLEDGVGEKQYSPTQFASNSSKYS
jgi:hypothetical protein